MRVHFSSGGTNSSNHRGKATQVWVERKVLQLFWGREQPGDFLKELAPVLQLAAPGFLTMLPSPRSVQNVRLKTLELEIYAGEGC